MIYDCGCTGGAVLMHAACLVCTFLINCKASLPSNGWWASILTGMAPSDWDTGMWTSNSLNSVSESAEHQASHWHWSLHRKCRIIKFLVQRYSPVVFPLLGKTDGDARLDLHIHVSSPRATPTPSFPHPTPLLPNNSHFPPHPAPAFTESPVKPYCTNCVRKHSH